MVKIPGIVELGCVWPITQAPYRVGMSVILIDTRVNIFLLMLMGQLLICYYTFLLKAW